MTETVKGCLQAYGAARRNLLAELEALQDARGLAARVCETVPGAQQMLQVQLAELERRCTETAAAMYFQMEAVQDLISRLEVPLQREILERRYLREEGFREIAEATHYSEGHVRRLHREALQQLAEYHSENNTIQTP